jgi:hypothetical protein
MFVNPPANVGHIATAFRETNTDKEKDLDSSVLWKAMSSLRAATTALERHYQGWHGGWLEGRYGKNIKAQKTDVKFRCRRLLGFVDVFHPVIVIEANLWIVGKTSLASIDACRFHQLDSLGSVIWWCDVVHRPSFDSFVKTASEHYGRFYRARRALLDGHSEG